MGCVHIVNDKMVCRERCCMHTPYRSRGRSTKRAAFSPSEQQLKTARRRIMATFKRLDGSVYAPGGSESAVMNVLVRHVHNRHDLGRAREGHFQAILQEAWCTLTTGDKPRIVYDARSERFKLAKRPVTKKRPRQRYKYNLTAA